MTLLRVGGVFLSLGAYLHQVLEFRLLNLLALLVQQSANTDAEGLVFLGILASAFVFIAVMLY